MTEEEIQQAIKFLEEKHQAGITTIWIKGKKYAVADLIKGAKLRGREVISLLEILKVELHQEFMMSI